MDHGRVLPSDALAPHVAHFWSVRWSLRSPFRVETLPHPSVHVVLEGGCGGERADVAGVARGRFTRELSGDGWVLGVKWRPAAFSPLLPRWTSTLAERVVPVEDIFGEDGGAWAQAAIGEPTLEGRIALAEAFFAVRVRPLDAEVVRVRDLVERMAVDRSLRRVEEAATALGVDVRTLQRWFRRYVGVSPKWVLGRYRLHEAAEQLKAPHPPTLAALADALGYADQAHFTRDFKRFVGRSPSAFQK